MTRARELTPSQCMDIHINTLYCVDEQDRLRCVNEIGEPPAPLFYLGRTLLGNTWRFRHDLPAAIAAQLNTLCESEPVATDLTRLPQNYAAILAVLREHWVAGGPQEYRGLAYWIPDHIDDIGEKAIEDIEINIDAHTNVVSITKSNIDLCQRTFPWLSPLLHDKNVGPIAATVVAEQAVALCFCSRRPGFATEAGVETLAAYRGRGYATATVRAWAAAVKRLGCRPFYSTTWDNLASQAIARKLQMVMYGADWSIR